MLNPTEIARLLTIGHVVAHGLREIRAVDTPLESDPFVIYGVDAYHEEFRGDIRDPDGLKGLIEQSGNDDDVGYLPDMFYDCKL